MLFRCYRDGAEYIPCLVECDQLTEGFEVVEPALVTVELFVVLQHSDHVQAFTENVMDKGLICEPANLIIPENRCFLLSMYKYICIQSQKFKGFQLVWSVGSLS